MPFRGAGHIAALETLRVHDTAVVHTESSDRTAI
jgi:hypothetical protein